MIGGLKKTVSRLAIVAAAGAMSSTAAMAADLGGNCCSDLEERVAELEATTARKGNRRVSLTVSGHVHEGIFSFDVDSNVDDSLDESNTYIGTPNSSRSRFRFRGSANINADWSAGFYMEFGVRRNALNNTSQNNPRAGNANAGGNGGEIDIRHEALYVKSKRLGTFWLGWTGSAIEGITEICLGCTLGNASPDYSFTVNDLLVSGVTAQDRFDRFGSASGFFAGEGDRRNMIKYISPTFAGFALSASWGGDDFWDVALRYAAEWGDFRVGAGIGYSQDTNGVDSAGVSAIGCNGTNGIDDQDCTTLGGSVSVQHVPTGLYTRFSYGKNENEAEVNGNDEDHGWEVTVGLNRKWIALGKTGIWGVYGVSEREIGLATAGDERELEMWGLGIDQKIDAAAMEVYLWYRHFEAEENGVDQGEADVVTLGTRIKF